MDTKTQHYYYISPWFIAIAYLLELKCMVKKLQIV